MTARCSAATVKMGKALRGCCKLSWAVRKEEDISGFPSLFQDPPCAAVVPGSAHWAALQHSACGPVEEGKCPSAVGALLHIYGISPARQHCSIKMGCFLAVNNGILHTHSQKHTCNGCLHIQGFLQKYKTGMGWLSICSNLGLGMARSQPHDVQECPCITLLPTLVFCF